MSYVTSYYHIVFATKHRQATIDNLSCQNLYRLIGRIISNRQCKPFIVNGVENHIHILLGLHSDVALSTLVRDIKSQSSVWMKNSGEFPMFEGWESEYAAFSISASHRDSVYEYIKNQKTHHADCHLEDEFNRLILKNGLIPYYKS